MGKSFYRNIHRRQRWPKSRRKRERRRIRCKNRQLKDKTRFTSFVRKTWPFVFENHSTIPNIMCNISLNELTSFTLLELGKFVTQRYVSSNVKNMSMMDRVNDSIEVIREVLPHIRQEQDIYKDMLKILKFLIGCKKQLLRRGATVVFKGHSRTKTFQNSLCDVPEKQNNKHELTLPPLYPRKSPITQPVKKSMVVTTIPNPPPLPTKEQLLGRANVTVQIASKVDTKDVPLTHDTHEEQINEENNNSWSCGIM